MNIHVKVEELVVWRDDSQDFSEGELRVLHRDLKKQKSHINVEFVHNSRNLNVGRVLKLSAQMLNTLTFPKHKHTLFKYDRDELPKTIAWSFITT